MNILSPKLDIVFKKLFSSAESKDILTDFLASVLDVENDSIKDLVVTNADMLPENMEQKYSRLDIVLNMNGAAVNIEMQVRNVSDFKERALYYWAKLYCRDIKEGETYSTAKQTISINILDFNMFDCEQAHSVFQLRENTRGELFSDKCRFDFLELKKAETDNSRSIRRIKRWMRFLNAKSEEEFSMLERENDTSVNKAILMLKKMSADDKMAEIARVRERAMHDEASYIRDALNEGILKGRKEGLQQGMQQGRKEGLQQGRGEAIREVVYNLFDDGQPTYIVKIATNLSDEKISQYRIEYEEYKKHNSK